MITNPQKTSHRYLRKLLVLPVTVFVLILFAFKYKNRSIDDINRSAETITIVVDAGHGGIDLGAKSIDGKYTEAQLNFRLAKTIQLLAPEYNVKVVMTRENEDFPGNATNVADELKKRLDIIRESGAELFLSLHTSSTTESSQNTHAGFKSYISSKNNNVQSQHLASSVLQNLAGIYKTDLIIKKRNAGIYVLDKNVCPSVILECGDINNQEDMTFVSDKTNQEKIARRILEAIVNYKRSEEGSTSSISTNTEDANVADTIKLAKVVNHEIKDTAVTANKIVLKEGIAIKKSNGELKFLHDATVTFESGAFPLKDTSVGLLVILNGKEYGRMKSIGDIDKDVNVDDIESINVLKGGSAVAKYGEKGKNGVIEIITKKKNDSKFKEINSSQLNVVVVVAYLEDKGRYTKLPRDFKGRPFVGGEKEWRAHLERNINATVAVDNGAPVGTYTTVTQFLVNADGTTSEFKSLTNQGYGMEEEALRVIQSAEHWEPAVVNGKKVNAYKKQPVMFVVEEKNHSISQSEYPIPPNEDYNDPTFRKKWREMISEIKAIAWKERKAAYEYRGRTYIFGQIKNPDSTVAAFTEQNGTGHVFLLNGKLIESVDDLNALITRNDVKKFGFISQEEMLKRFNRNEATVFIETVNQ